MCWAGFYIGAIGVDKAPSPIPITWKSHEPIWTPQWPLTLEKLKTLKGVIQEQLEKGHFEPSFSHWNSPIFAVKKR